jgi:hypothetical protein
MMLVSAALNAPGRAQIIEQTAAERPTAVTYGPTTVARYRFGAKVAAKGGMVKQIGVMVAVPLECPEQEVVLIDEEMAPHVESVEYRQTDEGVRQMLIYIRELAPRQEAHALVTYEVRTRTVLPPKETATLVRPKKPDRKLKRYLAASPFIDVNDRRIRAAVREAVAELESPAAGATGDWGRVEALYDYAVEHVKYLEGDDQSSVQALARGQGDCQAIGAVFVAMCRTEKVPARMVWVDGHQYAEFYLEDETGAGCWYPIETAGSRAFGEMPLARVILQKGDNFRVPERPRDRLRYATDYAKFLSAPDLQPSVTYVREAL